MTTVNIMAAIAETAYILGTLYPSSHLIAKPFYVGARVGGDCFIPPFYRLGN